MVSLISNADANLMRSNREIAFIEVLGSTWNYLYLVYEMACRLMLLRKADLSPFRPAVSPSSYKGTEMRCCP